MFRIIVLSHGTLVTPIAFRAQSQSAKTPPITRTDLLTLVTLPTPPCRRTGGKPGYPAGGGGAALPGRHLPPPHPPARHHQAPASGAPGPVSYTHLTLPTKA